MSDDINYEDIEPAEATRMATKMLVEEMRAMRKDQRENTERLVKALKAMDDSLQVFASKRRSKQ